MGGSVGRRVLNGIVTIQPIAIAPAIKHRMLRYFNRGNFVLTRRRDLTGRRWLWSWGCICRRRGCIWLRISLRISLRIWLRRLSISMLSGVVSKSHDQFIIGRRLNDNCADRIRCCQFYCLLGRLLLLIRGKISG
jgi:hypothetical protein